MLLLALAALVAFAAPPTDAPEPPPIVRFVNGTTDGEVTGLYISDCGAQDYWDNLLERPGYAGLLVPGATVGFRVPPGCYDLHATFYDGPEVHQSGISLDDDMLHRWTILFGTPEPEMYAPSRGGDVGVIAFSNRSRFTISELYITPCGESWGENSVSDSPMRPGESVDLEVFAGCWDVYVRLTTGQLIEYDHFEVAPGAVVERWVRNN